MKTILMIGLGRFGTNTSRRLCELGHEVMGVDRRRESVENAMRWLTSGQIGDSTDEKFLRSLGVRNFDICFVSMGDDFKSSLVTTTLLKELGVSYVVAVAEEDVQEYLLKRVGADEVIYPQKQLGEWAAVKYSADHVTDYFRIDGECAVYEVDVPRKWIGHGIGEIDVRRRYGISIIGIREHGHTDVLIHPDTVLSGKMTLLVVGDDKKIQKCFRI